MPATRPTSVSSPNGSTSRSNAVRRILSTEGRTPAWRRLTSKSGLKDHDRRRHSRAGDTHDRMHAVMALGHLDAWLALQAYRVSRAVNTPRNNAEQLLQPVA